MERLDALGNRPDRRPAFSPTLLSEAEDDDLDRLVALAAERLDSPIALVSLVLDHIQFFKAHHGLPPELAKTRSTRRDVSFCQFVVRDGTPFEVQDANSDTRIPQYVVSEYGIQSYLGFPLRVGDTVVGSLCVLDTKAREFSEQEHAALFALSQEVTQRVRVLASQRRKARLELTEDVTASAINEANRVFRPVLDNLSEAIPALAAIRSALHHYEHTLIDGNATSERVTRATLSSASAALSALEGSLHDLDANTVDCVDTLLALQLLTQRASRTPFADVVLAAQDLSRASTRAAGGLRLPDLPPSIEIATSRPMAVAILSAALHRLANLVTRTNPQAGLHLNWESRGSSIEITVSSAGLEPEDTDSIAEGMRHQLGDDPSFSVSSARSSLILSFPVSTVTPIR
jgi:hypothetical protein